MAVIPAYAISANSLTAETFRQAPASDLAGAGVVNSGDFAVTQNGTPNMSVNVAAGQIWVPGTLASTTGFGTNITNQAATFPALSTLFNQQSCYYGWNNGTVNLTIAASDPTNPRWDLVVVSVQDAAYSGSNNQMVIQVITGTPAASPSFPTVPASSVVVGWVTVPANATSIVTGNITDERPRMAPLVPITQGRGMLAQASATTGTANTSTNVDWFSAPAVTFDGTRRIKISYTAGAGGSNVGNLAAIRLMTSTGTVVQAMQIYIPAAGGSGVTGMFSSFWEGVIAAGSATFKLNAQFVAGTGTISGTAAATSPAYLTIEDVGL